MPSLSEIATDTDEQVRRMIVEDLEKRPTSSVVSINSLVAYIRTTVPETERSDRQLAKMVFEAAMQLGLVPVYDPERAASGPSGDFRGHYGYGHRAHTADPGAQYGFKPETMRPLPVNTRNRWR